MTDQELGRPGKMTWKNNPISNQEHDDVCMEVKYFDKNETKQHRLSRDEILRDLSNLQIKWQADQRAQYCGIPPMVGLWSPGGQYVAVHVDWYLHPWKRDNPDAILAVLDEEQWNEQKQTFVNSYVFTVNEDHTTKKTYEVWLDIDKKGRVSSISKTMSDKATKFFLTYHIVASSEANTHYPIACLLPMLLTGTNVSDMNAVFVYAHFQRADVSLHQRVWGTDFQETDPDIEEFLRAFAKKLIDRPIVLESKLENCNDAGRRLLMSEKMSKGRPLFETASAVLVLGLSSKSKQKRDVSVAQSKKSREVFASEVGRNQVQEALSFAVAAHPSHIKADKDFYVAEFKEDKFHFWKKLAIAVAEAVFDDNKAWAEKLREQARERHVKAYDANERTIKEDHDVKELRRKLQAGQTRLANAEAPPKAFSAYVKPPTSCKSAKKMARQEKKKSVVNSMEHHVHVLPEQRALRAEAFDLRQQLKHSEALAAKMHQRTQSMIKLEKDMSAAKEAAEHVIPPLPQLSDFVA